MEFIYPPPLQVKWSFPKKIEVIEQTQKVYFWANQGDELQPKKVVKSEIELGLPFMALDLVYKSFSYSISPKNKLLDQVKWLNC
jgi:hypothetical protein